MGGTGISREALLQQLIAAATQNPAAQGSIPMQGRFGGGMRQMPPIPPGSFNPNSPASIERGAFTGRSPFDGAQPDPARARHLHAALAAQAMNMSNPQSGPAYGGSNPMNPFGEGNVTAGGLQTGEGGKQKNPLQQGGAAIKALVSFLIDQ